MVINTTEELAKIIKERIKKMVKNHEIDPTRCKDGWVAFRLGLYVFPVEIEIGINGTYNKYGGKNHTIFIDDALRENFMDSGWINLNTLELHMVKNTQYGLCSKKVKNDKYGRCEIFYKNALYFSTEEEAEDYVANYAKEHPEEVVKALEKFAKERRRDIRETTKELKAIERQIKELEK